MLAQLTSAIQNNIYTGLKGITTNTALSLEQIEDSIISERLLLIKEYSSKGMLPIGDLAMSINCLQVDCKSIDKCCSPDDTEVRHVEVPQIANDYGSKSVVFLGSTDRQTQFTIYTDSTYKYHNLRRSKKLKPYVWIDTTPNLNNMNDIFIFNAPFLQVMSITAIFKDPRQLEGYSCCGDEIYNFNFLDKEIEKRVSNQYIEYYRRLAFPPTANNQAIH